MAAGRVMLTGVAWSDGLMVPVRDGDGSWFVLAQDMVSYYDRPADVRRFADAMAVDGLPDEEVDAYRLMADVMEAWPA
jgi:hypothetical protein